MTARTVRVPAGDVSLTGDLTVPPGARSLVLFAHGSGSSRHSPRNREVATVLEAAGVATLLVDLLTADEAKVDDRMRQLRFDVELLARRLVAATDWVGAEPATAGLTLGYFGASTGAACAIVAAAQRPAVAAVVSRGGRPDLAGDALGHVRAPTLLIVGGADDVVLELNRRAATAMTARTELEVVAGAGHLFAEPGALEQVADLAARWFSRYLERDSGAA